VSGVNPTQSLSAFAQKAGGPLKAADTYARSVGDPSECKPGAECAYNAALSGCISTLRKTHRDDSYFLIYTRAKQSPREAAIYQQAARDCRHL
jgi:hypothetical protein